MKIKSVAVAGSDVSKHDYSFDPPYLFFILCVCDLLVFKSHDFKSLVKFFAVICPLFLMNLITRTLFTNLMVTWSFYGHVLDKLLFSISNY